MSYKWGYNNHTIDKGSYGAPPSQFGVVSPTRAQVERAVSDASYREAAAAQEQIKKKAKQYRLKNNLPRFNDRFPPKKLSRTRSRPSSRTRSRSNKSRKRSRHSV